MRIAGCGLKRVDYAHYQRVVTPQFRFTDTLAFGFVGAYSNRAAFFDFEIAQTKKWIWH
jgi:hypothetical protein